MDNIEIRQKIINMLNTSINNFSNLNCDSIVDMGNYYLISNMLIHHNGAYLLVDAVYDKTGKVVIGSDRLMHVVAYDESNFFAQDILTIIDDKYYVAEKPGFSQIRINSDGTIKIICPAEKDGITDIYASRRLRKKGLIIATIKGKKYLQSCSNGETLSDGYDNMEENPNFDLGLLVTIVVDSDFVQKEIKSSQTMKGLLGYDGRILPLNPEYREDLGFFDNSDRTSKIAQIKSNLNKESIASIKSSNRRHTI